MMPEMNDSRQNKFLVWGGSSSLQQFCKFLAVENAQIPFSKIK